MSQGISYAPAGPIVKSFHESQAFVRGIMGPIGSGKSTACVIEILRKAQAQTPGPDGVRRTRWAVIRNSYPELKSTTWKTWSQWVPAQYGKTNFDSPITHHVRFGDLDMEVLFMALDHPDDQRKLLSLELTGAWINEAREVPKTILDALTGRVGRYPSKVLGGCTWSGIMLDTNAPDTTSWWYKACEEERPEGWEFFKQPSGRGPDAENLANLPPKYYDRLIPGKDPDWIKVYVDGEYGYLIEGKPVFPQYRDSFHCATEPVLPVPQIPLLIGADFGLTPAAAIAQKMPDGQWKIVDELVTDNTGIKRFAELLVGYISLNYPDFVVGGCWGDPSGNVRSFSDEETALDILNSNTPWTWRPAPGDNTWTTRLEAVRGALNRTIDGKPGLLISPKAAMIRKGLANGYHYKLALSGNGAVTHETPNKNEYSHVAEALQYLLLGGGEFDMVLNRIPDRRKNRVRMAIGFDKGPFD